MSAQVISKDTVEFFRVAHVTLDRSSPDIQNNARLPVITLDGVVGTGTHFMLKTYKRNDVLMHIPDENERPKISP